MRLRSTIPSSLFAALLAFCSAVAAQTPYLLVDRIVAVTETEVVTEKNISGDEFFLTGHFPGAPIFPGAMLQEFTTQSAGILIAAKYNPMEQYDTQDPFHNEYALGVLVRVRRSRF